MIKLRTGMYTCLLLVLCVALQATVQAQDTPVRVEAAPGPSADMPSRTLSERLLLHQQWMMYRENEWRSIHLGPPLAGLLLGAGAAATSAWLYTTDPGVITGTAVALVAVPLVVGSIVKLVERVKKRRSIERDIWKSPPIARAGFGFRF